MTWPPGLLVQWCGQRAIIVDRQDPKLVSAVRKTDPKFMLICASNGQLVWVRVEDLAVVDG